MKLKIKNWMLSFSGFSDRKSKSPKYCAIDLTKDEPRSEYSQLYKILKAKPMFKSAKAIKHSKVVYNNSKFAFNDKPT